jgi:membrane protein implicated in regulation of membrane protease activity
MFALYVLVMCYVFYLWLRDRKARKKTMRWLKRQRLQGEALEAVRDENLIKILNEEDF